MYNTSKYLPYEQCKKITLDGYKPFKYCGTVMDSNGNTYPADYLFNDDEMWAVTQQNWTDFYNVSDKPLSNTQHRKALYYITVGIPVEFNVDGTWEKYDDNRYEYNGEYSVDIVKEQNSKLSNLIKYIIDNGGIIEEECVEEISEKFYEDYIMKFANKKDE